MLASWELTQMFGFEKALGPHAHGGEAVQKRGVLARIRVLAAKEAEVALLGCILKGE